MEIAYNQILLLLFQCLLIALLLASLFRLRSIFGLGLLYITLGVFQFLQVLLSSSLFVEVASGIFISSGSMVLFTATLFMVLLVYIREDALETRKIIYALLAANLVTSLLLVVFGWSVDNDIVTNVYNLPKEFFSNNARVLLVGTVVFLLDALALIFLYEFISKYIKSLFFRILFTMSIVLSIDTILFSFGVFWKSDELLGILFSGLISKFLAAIVYSSFYSIYLVYLDQKSMISESKVDTFKDIFNTLTFRQKYEDVFQEMKIKSSELLDTQKIAQLGSYVLDIKTGNWTSSSILNDVFGIDLSYKRNIDGWLQIIHSEDRVMMNEYLSINIITNQEKFNKEYRIINQLDHQIIWVHGMGDLEYDDKGNLVKMVGTIQDITERKKIELELINSERKFKNLFDKSPVSLWEEDFSIVKRLIDEKKTQTNDLKKYLDENPNFVFNCVSKVKILNVNNITLDLFGVKNTEELTNHLSKTFNDKSIQMFKEELLAIASNKKEFSGETEFIRTDGEIITALINFLIIDDNYEKAIVSIVDITELNKAKEKIVDSQRKFKKLFDKNSVSLWDVDFYEIKKILDKKKTQTENLKKYLDDNIDFVLECVSKIEILDVNEVSLDLMGANTKIELINNLGKNFNEKTLEVFKKQLIAIALNEREFSGETEFVKSSGEIITTYLKYVRINDTNDRGIISIIDITPLNTAKEKIVDSEKRFRELYEKSGDAILIIKNGIFTECNQATVDMLEYKSKDDFLTSHPSKLSPILQPDGKKSFDKAIEMMDESLKKGTHRFEWIHTKQNGAEFPVEVLLTAITNEPDNQTIHCVWRDISDRIEIKALLEKSEEKFSKAFIHNPTPLHITSIPDGIFIDINPMFENISGYTRKEVIGKTALELNFYIDIEDRVKYFELLKSKGRVENHEIQFRAKNGSIRDCNIFSEIIEIDKKPCILSIVRDVTEQKKAEEALRSLATKFSFMSGSNFIENVCRHISETLNVEIAFVGELEPVENRVIVNYGVGSGKPLESFEYDLTGTPCEKVMGKEACSFPKGVQELFPSDHLLIEMNIEGYIGVPLFNSSGKALGILVILDSNIIDNPSFATTMLQIFSERIAAEIERTSAEEALKVSLNENEILLNATSDLVILLDTEGRIKAVNKSMAKSLRSTTDKLLNKAYNDFLPSTIAKSRKEIGIKAAKTGKVVRFIDKTDDLWFDNSVYPIFDKNQNLSQLAIFSQDITSRKKAEQSLIESENELRQSQEIAQLGTFNFNISTQVFVSSPIFDSIVGFKTGDNKTLVTYKEIVHPDDFDMNEKMLIDCIKTSKKFNREYRIFNYSTKELMWLHGFGEIIIGEKDEMHFKGTIQDITERKLIELEVKLNERKLKEIQKIANLGTYEIDLETNNITTSELYNSIFGIKKKPISNKGWWKSITHPEDFEQSELLWQQCIKECKPYNDQYRILTENNEIRWIQDIAEVKGENGMATKVVGTVQDITERKKSEEQIKRSDDILNQINSLVVVNNSRGDIVYISPSVKNILGYEPSVMLGRGWWRLTYPEDKLGELRIKEIFNHFNGDNSISDAVSVRRIKTKGGNYKLIEWHISKASDDTFISIGIDVTEQREQEEQFKTLTETAHDAIILVDHKGFIFEWNKSSEETFGYSKGEIEGKAITSLMPEKYRNQYQIGFSEVMQKGLKESYRNNIVEGLTKEGVVFPMELSLNFWESNNNYVYCYFIRDITQRERDEKIKELIFNITNKSNEVLNLNKFFHYIKTELGKLINTDNFFIALYDEKTEMISTPYMVDELDTASDFPKGKTLTGHVIDTKGALLTKEIILDKESEDLKPIGLGPESKCWLGVPMLIEDKAIGAIVVQSYTDENAFTENDVEFLELVASNIGQAVKKTEDLVQLRLLNKALIQSPQAVIITNIIGDIEYINPAFTGLSGYSEEDVIGKNPRILKSSKHLPEYYNNLWQTISKGQTWEGEFVNRHKDGSNYLVDANISSVKNENGKITHYIGVQEDITEKRKLERQFINTFIDAQEVEKQNFGEELHDSISQILSAEGMYINLLIEQNQDRINDKAKFLTKIKELNTNAVNETRSIAHGLMSTQLKQSGLLIATENICIDFNNSKSIMFSFLNIDVKEDDISKEIKTNLFRVIQELTTNITRYSSATNASVGFSKVDKDKLKLVVKDNGIGMDYDKIKNERKVTGLKNVERRIIFLNGTLDVNSRPNKGTRWKIIIPLQNIQ